MSIEFKQIAYTYLKNSPFESKVLDNINFYIKKGEVCSIIGHTGSGKSTIVQIMNLLLEDFDGELLIDSISSLDKNIKYSNFRRKFGFSFQYPEYQFFEDTVFNDIAFSLKIKGKCIQDIRRRVKESMDMVSLDFHKYSNRNPFELSGGEKRRVSLASILVLDPEYIILDEPTVGLDPKTREEIISLIEDLNKKFKKTIILVTHVMDLVYRVSDKVIVMNNGKIEKIDNAKNIFSDIDLIERCCLNKPSIIEFYDRLLEKGIILEGNSRNLEDLKKEIVEFLEKKRSNND